ncbi:MAG: SGNH/GDSL hydrolase family protein [Rikenellaceae bacterium]
MKKIFSTLTLLALCFSSLQLFAQGDSPTLKHRPGGMWHFYADESRNENGPNILLIGDSVLSGYAENIVAELGEANVDYWLTPMHLTSKEILEDLQSVVSFRDYDVIQFNIGLHGWQADRMTEEAYPQAIKEYVKALKKSAKKSKLIWATVTPVTEDGVMALNAEINPVIINKNESAAKIMSKYKVTTNDLYGLVVDRLDLAKLDRFHWSEEGSKMMSDQSIRYIKEALKK